MNFEVKASLKPLRTTIRRIPTTKTPMELSNQKITGNHSPLKNITQRFNVSCQPRSSLSIINQWPRRKNVDASPMSKIRKSLQTPQIERKRPAVEISPSPIRRKSIRVTNKKYGDSLTVDNNVLLLSQKKNSDTDIFNTHTATSSTSSFNSNLDCSIEHAYDTDINTSVSVSLPIQKKNHPTYEAGVSIFNCDPYRGMKYLIQNNFVDLNPQTIANELKKKEFSRIAVGKFFGLTNDPLSKHVLEEFIKENTKNSTFQKVDEALRDLLYYFVPNGEAQKINELINVFAKYYCKANPDSFSYDTIVSLSYAIILLHTDHFNKNANKKFTSMTEEQFISNYANLRNTEVPRDYLSGVYKRVTSREFPAREDCVSQLIKISDCFYGPEKSKNFVKEHRRLLHTATTVKEIRYNAKQFSKPKSHSRALFIFNDTFVLGKEPMTGRLSLPRRSSAPAPFKNMTNNNYFLGAQYQVKKTIGLDKVFIAPPNSNRICIKDGQEDLVLEFNSISERDETKRYIQMAMTELDQLNSAING